MNLSRVSQICEAVASGSMGYEQLQSIKQRIETAMSEGRLRDTNARSTLRVVEEELRTLECLRRNAWARTTASCH